jgi:hypothetical protein
MKGKMIRESGGVERHHSTEAQIVEGAREKYPEMINNRL